MTASSIPSLTSAEPGAVPPTIVVVGNGMVGQRFCDLMTEPGAPPSRVVTFGDEPHPAYDRVHLSEYLSGKTAGDLTLAPREWYGERGISLCTGERVVAIDRERRVVVTDAGREQGYDFLVLATGSAPFVPPIPGTARPGVFVYRTFDDLDAIRAYAQGARRAAVIGGGLLGLEAAKAALDLGLETHVVEFAPRLMPRQLDDHGAQVLRRKIEALGITVHLNCATTAMSGEGTHGAVTALEFKSGEPLEVDLVIISAGIRPRDELAKVSGLELGARGGIVVDDELRTSDPSVFAIGECALHRGNLYGLVGPGYQMADVVRQQITRAVVAARDTLATAARFTGADLSTKLKLLGVDVASFGDPLFAGGRTVEFVDTVAGTYKKVIVHASESRLLGGILVGDAQDYMRLLGVCNSGAPFEGSAEELLLGPKSGAGAASAADAPDSTQICSCNSVTKGAICAAVRDKEATTVAKIKSCTRAGSGCGGCLPQVTDLLNLELRRMGVAVKPVLCEHFAYTRQELYQIVKVKRIQSFPALLAEVGKGNGCEICKPAVASILASVFNECIVKHDTLQDTNDRFLANIQRGGLYSVVPRIPGGEITPQKLIALGRIADKYGLYTKITGGQRIDLFGAHVGQLPQIWEELIQEGFESGHAYGKALRTVKSCVGSTWCRYGVQDSVGFAIRVEERYRGLRAPHKLKSAVSGCVRECAEAQSKDFGIIATEKGWNLYVCGNGGAKPRHADLLASDLDEETCIKLIDRFLMFYIATADRLTRTSVWLEKLEGGLEHLKNVIIHDSLGICAQLETDMQYLVDSYRCEWAEVVKDPAARAQFAHFANSTEADSSVEWIEQRGQRRPKDWPKAGAEPTPVEERVTRRTLPVVQRHWVRLGQVGDFPVDGGRTLVYGRNQLAVYNFASRGTWYAVQNRCPHMNENVLARGIIGDQSGEPKVACPLHKKSFSLETGKCLGEDSYAVQTFPVKVEDGWVFVELPSAEALEEILRVEPHECAEAAE